MDLEREQQIQNIAEEVLSLETQERTRYMNVLVARDAALAEDVKRLLGNALHVAEAERAVNQDAMIGKVLGSFRLVKLLGFGGMGRVYLAEQQGVIERQVAVKFIGKQSFEEAMYQRFKIEQQMLANLSHPNVANLYESGMTEDGVPYFAMEFIDGLPIHDYCKTHELDLHARLELFLQICDAIAHAHFKGVIHRDIKPSNILVYRESGRAIAKVIDFGISKPTTSGLKITRTGSQMGSLPYMSPEQAGYTDAAGRPLDIDVRSDIYSLGAVLYQLLTDVLPLTWEESASFKQMLQDICDREPTKPSRRLELMEGNRSDQVSKHRSTTIGDLISGLKSDLDWVVMKALQKDREHRYRSVSQFSDDIRAYINGFPVSAGPPTFLYIVRKFLGRNRLQTTVLAVILLAFVLVPLSYTIATRRQQVQVEKERDRAEQMVTFLVDLFRDTGPQHSGGERLTAVDILDRGYEDSKTKLKDQPFTQARVLVTIGRVFHGMGIYDKASMLADESLMVSENLDEIAPPRYEAQILQCEVWVASGEYAKAETSLKEIIATSTKDLGEHHLLTSRAWFVQTKALLALNKLKQAEASINKALAGYETALPDGYDNYSRALLQQSIIFLYIGQHHHAEDAAKQIFEILKDKSDVNPIVLAGAHSIVGIIADRKGDHHKSEHHFRETDSILISVLGPNHPKTMKNLHNIAIALQGQARYGEATSLMLESVHGLRQNNLGEPSVIAGMVNNLGYMAFMTGDYPSAIGYTEEALDLYLEALDVPHHFEIGKCHYNLAKYYLWLDQKVQAEVHATYALEHYEAVVTDGSAPVADARVLLAEALLANEKYQQAEALHQLVNDCLEEDVPEDSQVMLKNRWVKGRLLAASGKFTEAEKVLLAVYNSVQDLHCEMERYEGQVLAALANLERDNAHPTQMQTYQTKYQTWLQEYSEKTQKWQQTAQIQALNRY